MNKLEALFTALNGIEVKGEKNLNNLLVAIQLVKQLIQEENSNGMESN